MHHRRWKNFIIKPRAAMKLVVINVSLVLLTSVLIEAQVISPEFRRVAVSTNQFGIDVLKALHRIEPPDKVLVFCPVCLSSSFMMIMMGSSKYQVVSSLRHALYVWSMRPQEINRGFKDLLEHIEFNQNHQVSHAQPFASPLNPSESRTTKAYANFNSSFGSPNHSKRSGGSFHISPSYISRYQALSLPNLIKIKDFIEMSAERPWWHSISRREDHETVQVANSTQLLRAHHTNLTGSNDTSQMSALSNIYIQRGLSMNYNYNLLLRQYYKTVIHPVDFLHNSEETRLHINSLVAANTEYKIKDLVKKGSFNSPPKILIISTFHFRGTLDVEMKSKRNDHISNKAKPSGTGLTRKRRNQQNPEENRPRNSGLPKELKSAHYIETQATPLKYGHFSSLDCSVIEIPFNNRLVTLVIVMPDNRNSTEVLLTKLSAQILSDLINSLVVKKLSLAIPVIKFDRGPINMSGLLKELGLENLLSRDKPYSTETGPNRWMRPSDIIHETSIDIGTMNPDWGQPEDRLKVGAHENRSSEMNHIKLDKPFFYFVMDSINSLILTMGRI